MYKFKEKHGIPLENKYEDIKELYFEYYQDSLDKDDFFNYVFDIIQEEPVPYITENEVNKYPNFEYDYSLIDNIMDRLENPNKYK
jgi:hypothetical protein